MLPSFWEGVENAEAIVSTKGVAGMFLGPVDLRNSMGLNGSDGDEDVYLSALKILDICKKLGYRWAFWEVRINSRGKLSWEPSC